MTDPTCRCANPVSRSVSEGSDGNTFEQIIFPFLRNMPLFPNPIKKLKFQRIFQIHYLIINNYDDREGPQMSGHHKPLLSRQPCRTGPASPICAPCARGCHFLLWEYIWLMFPQSKTKSRYAYRVAG